MPVGEGEFQGLHQGVDIGWRVVAETAQIEPVQDAQGLQQHRPLAPGAAAMHGDIAEPHRKRRFDIDVEV